MSACGPAATATAWPTPAPRGPSIPQQSPGSFRPGSRPFPPAVPGVQEQRRPQRRGHGQGHRRRCGEQWALTRSLWLLNSKLFIANLHSFIWAKPSRGAFYYPGLLNKNFAITKRWDLRCWLRSGSPAVGDPLLPLPVYQPLAAALLSGRGCLYLCR